MTSSYLQNLAALSQPWTAYEAQAATIEARLQDPGFNTFPLSVPLPEEIAVVLKQYLIGVLVPLVQDYLRTRVASKEYTSEIAMIPEPKIPTEISALIRRFELTPWPHHLDFSYDRSTSEWYIGWCGNYILSIHLATANHSLVWTGEKFKREGIRHLAPSLDRVYLLPTEEDCIHIFDAHTGLYQGFHQIPGVETFIVDGDTLYVYTNDKELVCYHAGTGVRERVLVTDFVPYLDIRGSVLEAQGCVHGQELRFIGGT